MEPNQDTGQVADTERGELIERMVMDIIQRQNLTKVGDVVLNLQKLDRFVGMDEIHDAISRLERRGEVNLSEENANATLARYLVDIEASAPFWISILATAAVMLALFALPDDSQWIVAKQIIGSVFLFVVPGYATVNALVARNRLSYVERMVLSVGLSLAAVALVGVVLAYGFAGIKLQPLAFSLAIYVVMFAAVGAYRDYNRRVQARVMHKRFLGEEGGKR